MVRPDQLGITSFIRSLFLEPISYETLLHFFHASSWRLHQISRISTELVAKSDQLKRVDDKTILVGDGVKVLKEARKMPAVKKMYQESENSAKASYIFGHQFGVIGVLTGNNHLFCTPLTGTIQDGDHEIRQWKVPNYQPVSQCHSISQRSLYSS